jgi:hypothetical protein
MNVDPRKYEIDKRKSSYYDSTTENTNGVTIQFSGDPMLKAHQKRGKIRDQLTERCYKEIMTRRPVSCRKIGIKFNLVKSIYGGHRGKYRD